MSLMTFVQKLVGNADFTAWLIGLKKEQGENKKYTRIVPLLFT